MRNVDNAHDQKRGRQPESNVTNNTTNLAPNKRNLRAKRYDDELEELQELTMISLNIRGFNKEEKHWAISDFIRENDVNVVSLNETKLTIPVYIDNY